MNLGMTPLVGLSNGNYIYLVLIILIILTTFITFMFSMSTAENNEAANQMKIMMIFMIIVISVSSLNFPTALALYWIVNNIFAIVQNLIIKKISERR